METCTHSFAYLSRVVAAAPDPGPGPCLSPMCIKVIYILRAYSIGPGVAVVPQGRTGLALLALRDVDKLNQGKWGQSRGAQKVPRREQATRRRANPARETIDAGPQRSRRAKPATPGRSLELPELIQ
jgi:hypothetical protein